MWGSWLRRSGRTPRKERAPEVPKYETGRGPGSTADVDFWTSKDVREVVKSHLNYVVADTRAWEQQAAYTVDKHDKVDAFVKNQGLNFAIPYLHDGPGARLRPGFHHPPQDRPADAPDPRNEGLRPAGGSEAGRRRRWVAAVNADGTYGRWGYAMVKKMSEIAGVIDDLSGR